VDDLTTLGGNQARLVGVTAVTNKKDYAIRAVVNMSTTGNKQLLSGALFADGANVSHDTIDLITTGTPTLSIGDGTTVTKHTASTAVSAGRTRLAVTSPFPTAAANTGTFANVTVTGGAAEEVIVRGHLLN
jgi:predicted extracellular nuclease